jgi:16S rRNA (uracil1498-N3)-methyltransferase
MAAPRFYCPELRHAEAIFELPPDAAHHAARVLRLRVNEAVQVFDGKGNAFDAVIGEMAGRRVVLEKLAARAADAPPAFCITLAQSMCSSEKMDWIVQKAVELGAGEIQPVESQRSVAKLSEERAMRRLEHWRSVAVSACEQCGRNTLPRIHAPESFYAWLSRVRDVPGSKYILHPEDSIPLGRQEKPQGGAILLVGPEGGFADDEVLAARQQGFRPVWLGPRVLRTETAALAGIAALQTLWGDFA